MAVVGDARADFTTKTTHGEYAQVVNGHVGAWYDVPVELILRPAPKWNPPTRTQRRYLAAIRDRPTISTRELADRMGVTRYAGECVIVLTWKKGLVYWTKGKHRTLRLTVQGELALRSA